MGPENSLGLFTPGALKNPDQGGAVVWGMNMTHFHNG